MVKLLPARFSSIIGKFGGSVIIRSMLFSEIFFMIDDYLYEELGALTIINRRGKIEGLRIAIKNLDKVIELIRASEDVETALNALITEVDLSEIQAQAILDMQLRRLAALEIEKIENEFKELSELVEKRQMIITELGDQETYTVKKNELESLFVQKDVLDKKIQQCEQDWLELEEEIEKSSLRLGIN